MKAKLVLKCGDDLWKKVQLHKINHNHTDLNETVLCLLSKAVGEK